MGNVFSYENFLQIFTHLYKLRSTRHFSIYAWVPTFNQVITNFCHIWNLKPVIIWKILSINFLTEWYGERGRESKCAFTSKRKQVQNWWKMGMKSEFHFLNVGESRVYTCKYLERYQSNLYIHNMHRTTPQQQHFLIFKKCIYILLSIFSHPKVSIYEFHVHRIHTMQIMSGSQLLVVSPVNIFGGRETCRHHAMLLLL